MGPVRLLHRYFWPVAGIAILAVVACIDRDVTQPPADAPVALFVRADVTGASVAMVVVEVSAPDIATPLAFNLTIDEHGVASGTVTIPAGSNRVITMRAFDAGGIETHRGSVTLQIRPGVNPAIALVLAPLTGEAPINVTLGTLTVSIAPSADTLTAGETALLTATVTLSDGTHPPGPVRWATLDPGVATVVTLADGSGRVSALTAGRTTIVAVYAGTGGSATVVVSAIPTLQRIATGLTQPLYVTAPPNDVSRVFIVEQDGHIRVLRNGTLLPTPFLDVSGLILFTGERGLLSMAFHPDYASNGWFFLYYTDVVGTIQIARYTVSTVNPDSADPNSGQIILSIDHPTFTNHNGGLVRFGPDGMLYIGVGDGGGTGDLSGNAQNPASLLGKLLRIDVDHGSPYSVPADNPFVGSATARGEIWASGLRNPWRFAFHSVTHDLYIADVGQDSVEEVDVQPAASHGGENYGWNVMEGTHCYTPRTSCDPAGLVLPVFEYVHGIDNAFGCSIAGGYVYRGTRLPALVGRYVFGDFCKGWVRSFRFQNGAAGDVVDYTSQLGALSLITSFGEDASGELYITTIGGDVYQIVPN